MTVIRLNYKRSFGDLFMDCKKFREMIDAYHDGMLTDNEINDFTAHLGQCAECSSVFNQHKKTLELLSELKEEAPDYVSGAMEKVRSIHDEQRRKRNRRIIRYVSSVAAAVVVLVISAVIIRSGLFTGRSTESAMPGQDANYFAEDVMKEETAPEESPMEEAPMDSAEAVADAESFDESENSSEISQIPSADLSEEAEIHYSYIFEEEAFRDFCSFVENEPAFNGCFRSTDDFILLNISEENLEIASEMIKNHNCYPEFSIGDTILISFE